ncbi:hypothetical protein AAC387_Pa09g1193 [Persea americana]
MRSLDKGAVSGREHRMQFTMNLSRVVEMLEMQKKRPGRQRKLPKTKAVKLQTVSRKRPLRPHTAALAKLRRLQAMPH